MQFRNILCTAFLLCSQLTVANGLSDDSLSLYQNSSAEIRIEQFSPQIAQKFAGNSGVNKVVQTKIISAIESAYHPSHFEKHIVRAFDTSLNWQERRKILQWLDTPVGRKAALGEAMALMNATRTGMTGTIEKARRLESTTKAELVDVVEMAAMESALQLDINVFQASISTFAASAPKSQPGLKDYSTFFAATDSRRREIASLNYSFSRSLLSVAYSDFSKQEMKSTISFWGSPTGTRFSVALHKGITNAFNEANQRLNRDVIDIISTSTLASAN